jgi:hypothetical protein
MEKNLKAERYINFLKIRLDDAKCLRPELKLTQTVLGTYHVPGLLDGGAPARPGQAFDIFI